MFHSIEDAVNQIRNGGLVVVVDDEDRENEGDLIGAAVHANQEMINFMAVHARGLICAPITVERAAVLQLPPMAAQNEDTLGTAFTVSVDLAENLTTGISAAERAATIKGLAQDASADDFRRPGHVFPLIAKDGGVLVRAGHTEAAVDLARMADLPPAGVICEIMKEDGSMARLPDLETFAKEHRLPLISIQQLISARRSMENWIEPVAAPDLPTQWGTFRAHGYRSLVDGQVHMALVCGEMGNGEDVLTRVHSECLTGDVFHSLRCDCGQQLAAAMEQIQSEGRGVLLYMRQEGRGIGLGPKLQAYELQEQGLDTVEANEKLGYAADLRDYGVGAQILLDLGVKSLRLMTNNPRKLVGLEGHGLAITARVPLVLDAGPDNARYLETKKEKLGHLR